MCVPDKDNKIADVTLGLASSNDYLENNTPYMGVVVGRCAGRTTRLIIEVDLMID